LLGDGQGLKLLGVVMVLVVGVLAYYHYIYIPKKRQGSGTLEYVLPGTLPVVDTTADVRRVIASLHAGQPVRVTASIDNWAGLLLPDGATGWVPQNDLLDAQSFDQAEELLKQAVREPVQATGTISAQSNVHLKPSRDAMTIGQFAPGQRVEVYDRRLTGRESQAAEGTATGRQDVWYLVRGSESAGWVLGDFVSLDVPPSLANYAQGINMVAWMPLDTVEDDGQQIPQYLAADRIGTRTFDFNHIRVFTWWLKRHEYVTAYVEGKLDGYFPITVNHIGGVPYFRLRLVNDQGQKFQKVYGLFDTIVRPIGVVDGWTSDAMPSPSMLRGRRRKGLLARRRPQGSKEEARGQR
jgi:hypothetical protein